MAVSMLSSTATSYRASTQRPAGARQAALKAQRLSFSSSNFAASKPVLAQSAAASSQIAGRQQLTVIAGNKGDGGPFAPLVKIVRGYMGVKEFNQFRGKAISLHSQVIKDFCKQLGADTKQVQGLIRLAKKNGEKLGFLA